MTQIPNVTASTTDFVLNEPASAWAGVDKLIQQINVFSENGVPVTIRGLSSSVGLYIVSTTAVQGNPSVYGPGTIDLVLDPTNNDCSAES